MDQGFVLNFNSYSLTFFNGASTSKMEVTIFKKDSMERFALF